MRRNSGVVRCHTAIQDHLGSSLVDLQIETSLFRGTLGENTLFFSVKYYLYPIHFSWAFYKIKIMYMFSEDLQEAQMKCPRCHGIMVFEKFYGTQEHFFGWRCIYCGEVLDQVILENRAWRK